MKKRVNSTGRKRLDREHVRINLVEQTAKDAAGDGPLVEARFQVTNLGLSDESLVIVEAYRQGFTERLPWGTVADLRPARQRLLELGAEGVAFRVKVVEPETGRLLAVAKRIPVGDGLDARRQELLRVKTANLGQELWRIVVYEADTPELVLNDRIPDVGMRFREPAWRAAIVPAAMRAILAEVRSRSSDVDEDADPDDWRKRWQDLAEEFAGYEAPEDRGIEGKNEYIAWLDRACAGFTERFGFIDAMIKGDGETA